jgi:dihydrofolate synthase / folylpolyglutamate synthase
VNFEEARAWLAGLDILGMRFGTQRMTALLSALGDPHRGVPALHVVGTNGKSSTARFAAAVLGAGGARAGAYLSPHISDWNERVQIDGAPVAVGDFAAAAAAVREAAAGLGLPPGDAVTQFEAVTACAFLAFARAGADAWVVEAGLGGRYDATNVLAPGAAVVLTNVALDHTDLLGPDERAIAAEKLAVCADGHDRLVVGPCTPAAETAVAEECGRRGLRPERVGQEITVSSERGGGVCVTTPRGAYSGLRPAPAGGFQRGNLACAVAGAELVAGSRLDAARVRRAIAAVTIPGRLEWVPGRPPLVLDGAHNPEGMRALARALPALAPGRRTRVALVSVLGDKDLPGMIRALAPQVDAVVATGSRHSRARPAGEVAAAAREAGLTAEAVDDPFGALGRARALAGPGGLVVVAGSLYLLADVRPAVTG